MYKIRRDMLRFFDIFKTKREPVHRKLKRGRPLGSKDRYTRKYASMVVGESVFFSSRKKCYNLVSIRTGLYQYGTRVAKRFSTEMSEDGLTVRRIK